MGGLAGVELLELGLLGGAIGLDDVARPVGVEAGELGALLGPGSLGSGLLGRVRDGRGELGELDEELEELGGGLGGAGDGALEDELGGELGVVGVVAGWVGVVAGWVGVVAGTVGVTVGVCVGVRVGVGAVVGVGTRVGVAVGTAGRGVTGAAVGAGAVAEPVAAREACDVGLLVSVIGGVPVVRLRTSGAVVGEGTGATAGGVVPPR